VPEAQESEEEMQVSESENAKNQQEEEEGRMSGEQNRSQGNEQGQERSSVEAGEVGEADLPSTEVLADILLSAIQLIETVKETIGLQDALDSQKLDLISRQIFDFESSQNVENNTVQGIHRLLQSSKDLEVRDIEGELKDSKSGNQDGSKEDYNVIRSSENQRFKSDEHLVDMR
jgi:hypothetical protein